MYLLYPRLIRELCSELSTLPSVEEDRTGELLSVLAKELEGDQKLFELLIFQLFQESRRNHCRLLKAAEKAVTKDHPEVLMQAYEHWNERDRNFRGLIHQFFEKRESQNLRVN